MASVLFKQVSKTFGKDVQALDRLDLEIKDGEFMVLVGPSGCGKTTALRIVAGLEEATSGQVMIGDTVVNDVPPKDRDIAMVFQNYALYPHMSVYDNISFGLKLAQLPGFVWEMTHLKQANERRRDIDQRVRATAAMLDIEALLERKPKELSGGQRQRVALARAIVRRPRVFLMDEPLSNLDAKLRVQTRAELIRLHRQLGVTTIYVTHDQVEAMTMGQRLAVMHGGVLQQVGTPEEVYNNPVNQIVAGFVGSPPMNFLTAKVIEDTSGDHLDCGTFRLPFPPSKSHASHVGRDVTVGIRPEAILESSSGKGSKSDTRIKADIDVLEAMGSEYVAYLKIGTHTLLAKFEPKDELRDASEVEVSIPANSIHIFDIESGLSLPNQSGAASKQAEMTAAP